MRGRDGACGRRHAKLDAGLSVGRGELVVITDADSLLEPQAITRAVRPFEVHPDTCMAVGGGIRVANGSVIAGGQVVTPGVSWQGVGATQVLEYLHGFFATRIAWSELNGLALERPPSAMRHGEDLFIRSVNGPDAAWYRGTRDRHEGRVSAGGIEADVTFTDMGHRLDAAYRSRYRDYAADIVDSINAPHAQETTLKLLPR